MKCPCEPYTRSERVLVFSTNPAGTRLVALSYLSECRSWGILLVRAARKKKKRRERVEVRAGADRRAGRRREQDRTGQGRRGPPREEGGGGGPRKKKIPQGVDTDPGVCYTQGVEGSRRSGRDERAAGSPGSGRGRVSPGTDPPRHPPPPPPPRDTRHDTTRARPGLAPGKISACTEPI